MSEREKKEHGLSAKEAAAVRLTEDQVNELAEFSCKPLREIFSEKGIKLNPLFDSISHDAEQTGRVIAKIHELIKERGFGDIKTLVDGLSDDELDYLCRPHNPHHAHLGAVSFERTPRAALVEGLSRLRDPHAKILLQTRYEAMKERKALDDKYEILMKMIMDGLHHDAAVVEEDSERGEMLRAYLHNPDVRRYTDGKVENKRAEIREQNYNKAVKMITDGVEYLRTRGMADEEIVALIKKT